MPASTITLQQTANWASIHIDSLPLAGVGGYANEPFISIANEALSDLIADPNNWFFNRVEMPPLFTCANKQDYLFAGACAFVLNNPSNPSMGWAIDLSSNGAITVALGVVTVNTLEPHRFVVGQTVYLTGVIMSTGTAAKYNAVFTDNGAISGWTGGAVLTSVTSMSFSFAALAGQNNGDAGGAPGIVNFAYLTSASMQEVNNFSSPPNQYPLDAKRELPVISRIANPGKVAVMSDLGTGVIKIRFHLVPGSTIFAANLVYQAKPPLKFNLTSTWTPFPDNYQNAVNAAVLYRVYRYINSPLTTSAYQAMQAEIAKTQAADDAASTDVNVIPETPLMDGSISGWSGWW